MQYPGNSGGGGAGLLTTAGKLLFAGDGGGNFVALDRHDTASRCGTRASAASRTRPQTYMLDGHQYVLVAVGDTLYTYTLY